MQPTAVTEPNNELGERLMSANRCITIRDVATAVNAGASSAWSAQTEILESTPTLSVQETCILSNGNMPDWIHEACDPLCAISNGLFHVTYRTEDCIMSNDGLINQKLIVKGVTGSGVTQFEVQFRLFLIWMGRTRNISVRIADYRVKI